MRYLELYRHTDNDGDQLSADGIASAQQIGRERLHPPYDLFVSTGARRATEMLEILRDAAGQHDAQVIQQTGLRSVVEDRWRNAAKTAGSSEVEKIRLVDPELVEKETLYLGDALRRVVDWLPDGGRALVVGHSPTNEAAVLGVTATPIAPLGKGDGVLVVEDHGHFTVTPLDAAEA
jgi:phosphohistidine phosphatase SixA